MIQWQHCETFKPDGPCATTEEKDYFFNDIVVTLEIGENYVKFDEVETENSI